MSWMFDRLCEIAVADQVEVLIAADIDDRPVTHDAADLAEVLARAAGVPQLAITLVHSGASPRATLGAELESVDLEQLAPDDATCATATAIEWHRNDAGTALRVRGTVVALHETTDALHETADETNLGRTIDLARDQGAERRSVVATDAPGRTEQLRAASRSGIGIAIGGVDPEAQVRVDSFIGVVSILDALVTLRAFAFGGDGERVTYAQGASWPPTVDRFPSPALRRVV